MEKSGAGSLSGREIKRVKRKEKSTEIEAVKWPGGGLTNL